MLRNPSSILKACAAFALLQVTIATCLVFIYTRALNKGLQSQCGSLRDGFDICRNHNVMTFEAVSATFDLDTPQHQRSKCDRTCYLKP